MESSNDLGMFLEFFSTEIPKPIESKQNNDERYVSWGRDNLYCNFLIDLYEDCPIHSMILNQKTSYIMAQGIQHKDGSEVTIKFNDEDTPNEFIEKLVKNFITFNMSGIEVCFNNFNEPIEYHVVGSHKMRMNNSKSKFWISEDWKCNKRPIIYDEWRINNSTPDSKIYYFDGSDISLNKVYPNPEYYGCIKDIVQDGLISDFNLNNIEGQFSLSTLISVYRSGNVPEDQRRQLLRDFEKFKTGVKGKKWMLQVLKNPEDKITIDNISVNDWVDAYGVVGEKVKNRIYEGHQVTSQILYGVKTPGQLGGTTEFEVAYQAHKINYISNKRNQILSHLNKLLGLTGDKSLEFKESPLFVKDISEQTKLQVMMLDEMRKELGLPPLPNGQGQVLISQLNKPNPTQVQLVPGEQPLDSEKKSPDGYRLTEDDYEKVKHLGYSKDEFDMLEELGEDFDEDEWNKQHFDKESDVSKYLIDNDIRNLTRKQIIADIKKRLKINVTEKQLDTYIKSLKDSGVINIDEDSDGQVQIKPIPAPQIPKTRQIEVVYDYRKRNIADGTEILPTTRSFCRKLIEGNKYFTRADIQTMSDIFGYDVFKRGGGWWFNSKTGETYSHCRHYFFPIKVTRKSTQ